MKDRIQRYGFEENVDFIRIYKFIKGDEKGFGNKAIKDYLLTLDTGKETAMVENNRCNLTDAEICRARETLKRCVNGRPKEEGNLAPFSSKKDEAELFNKSRASVGRKRYIENNAPELLPDRRKKFHSDKK
jgi:hypothetical protein